MAWIVDAVPSAFADDYAGVVAAALAPSVGVQPDAGARQAAEGRLKAAGVIRGMQSRVLGRVQSAYQELNALGIIDWTLTAIPEWALDGLSSMAAALMSEEGGDVAAARYAGEFTRLRRMAMGGAAGQALATQKVRAVHAVYEARGMVRWTLFDVPVYAEESYVLLAATLLAPEIGEKADPAWKQMAEMDLQRVVSLPSLMQPVIGQYF